MPERLLGIEYVGEYLRRLLTENLFLSCFGTQTEIRLLERYCPDYSGLLVNLFEPVGVNAVGLALCGKDVYALDVSARDREKLAGLFGAWNREESEEGLAAAAGRVCAGLAIGDDAARTYLREMACGLYPRIKAALPHGGLGGIFLSPED